MESAKPSDEPEAAGDKDAEPASVSIPSRKPAPHPPPPRPAVKLPPRPNRPPVPASADPIALIAETLPDVAAAVAASSVGGVNPLLELPRKEAVIEPIASPVVRPISLDIEPDQEPEEPMDVASRPSSIELEIDRGHQRELDLGGGDELEREEERHVSNETDPRSRSVDLSATDPHSRSVDLSATDPHSRSVDAEPPLSVPPPSAIQIESIRRSSFPPFVGYGGDIEAFRPSVIHRIEAWGRQYFLNSRFTFVHALWPMVAVALVLFTRRPNTNYIFDEQEALLANPYVNRTNGLKFIDAIHRDFWGLAPDRSVGSYRPIPNFLWRLLWHVTEAPVFHQIYNVILHGVNAAVLAWIIYAWTKRRGLAYLSGFVFVTCAVLTEAVSGIVGIADVLGGLGALLAIAALSLPSWAMPLAVFASLLFGLFSKESALVCVPLVPLAALIAAPLTHPERPARFARAAIALVASAAAFVLYVELRKVWFPSPLPSDLQAVLPPDATAAKRWMHEFLVWFHQAPLPKDPLNNPLAEADVPHRIAGALRVYWRGLQQMVVPTRLSGDYSFPQEPIPDRIFFGEFTWDHWFSESLAGAAMMGLPLIGTVVLWIVSMVRERRTRKLSRFDRRADGTPADSLHAETFDNEIEEAPRTKTRWAMVGLGAFLMLCGLACGVAYLGLISIVSFRIPAITVPIAIAVGVPLFLLGAGIATDGMRRLDAPEPKGSTLPLGRVAPILLAIGFAWTVVSFFPHSNIPVVLPTVRAERFWYFPAIGTSLVFAVILSWIHETWRRKRVLWLGPVVIGLFLGFHALAGYRHAMDYASDLDFWLATKEAVPNSAKAHLNYSVMKGAPSSHDARRGDLATRLTESKIALALAPKWPMAHIYTGDTLCRMHKADEAWQFYRTGFDVGPNELSLIALALQCLHDEKQLKVHDVELREIAGRHEGSWIAYLAIDTLQNEDKNNGVAPKYRPRGYNQGPKDDKEEDDDDDPPDASDSASASGSADVAADSASIDPSATATSDDNGEPSAPEETATQATAKSTAKKQAR